MQLITFRELFCIWFTFFQIFIVSFSKILKNSLNSYLSKFNFFSVIIPSEYSASLYWALLLLIFAVTKIISFKLYFFEKSDIFFIFLLSICSFLRIYLSLISKFGIVHPSNFVFLFWNLKFVDFAAWNFVFLLRNLKFQLFIAF